MGGAAQVRILVFVGPHAAINATKTVNLLAISTNNPTKKDVVTTKTRVVR